MLNMPEAKISYTVGIYLFGLTMETPEQCAKPVHVNNKDTRATSMTSF